MLDGDRDGASQALSYLASAGYFERVRQRLWLRSGASADSFRLAARVADPYALAYGSALALHGGGSADRSEVLVASPIRFASFDHDNVHYRHVSPWSPDGLVRVPVGPEFAWATNRERTLVECVRVPANAGGLEEVLRGVAGLRSLDPGEVIRWVDFYDEANLASRTGFVLEATGLGDESTLDALEARRAKARFYLESGRRGGKLARRWNVLIPEHLAPAAGLTS